MSAVQQSFNRAAASYRQAATVQAMVAEHLAMLVPAGHYASVLEIGSGDGLFTEQLLTRIDCQQLVALDIAHAPLTRLPSQGHILALQADAEALPLRPGSIDLLVSSSSLQWFKQPQRSIRELLACLKPGSPFAFSVFCHGTFAEMAQVSKETGFGQVYPLPQEKELERIIAAATDAAVSMTCDTIRLTFADVMTFLRTQKATGASYSGSSIPCGKASLKRFIDCYNDKFATDEGIPVSYRIAYFSGIYQPVAD